MFVLSLQQLGAQSDSAKRLQMLTAMKESDVVGREQLAQLEEDIRQQDVILTGYQKDNEQLRNDMKQLRATNKANEERMFHENHKLKTEVANLRSVIVSPMSCYISFCIHNIIKAVWLRSHHKILNSSAEFLILCSNQQMITLIHF